MNSPQRLPPSLTPLDVALAALLRDLAPVAPIELPLAEALGCIAADMSPLKPHPPHDIAATDGWALRANDLVGASSYSPLPLSTSPVWVEAGDRMPQACDCVLDSDSVDQSGPLVQVLAEAIPGQGVRRAGGDIAGGTAVVEAGRRVLPRDLLIARAAGIARISRAPAARPHRQYSRRRRGGDGATDRGERPQGRGRCDLRRGRGHATRAPLRKRSIAGGCDLLLTIGGSGVGRTDATVTALAQRGEVIAHGIALQPGRTTAVGRIGKTPVIALQGAPDQAFAAWWTLALPVLDRLSGRRPRQSLQLPLQRKIASGVGIAEIVLLQRKQGAWVTLAVGDLSLDAIARAEAWLVVPGGAEGFAAGAPVDGYMLRE